MDCNKVLSYLDDYFDHSLSPEMESRIEEHLLSCPSCREAFENTEAIITLMKTTAQPLRLPSNEFFDRVLASAKKQISPREEVGLAPEPVLPLPESKPYHPVFQFLKSFWLGRSIELMAARAGILVIIGIALSTLYHDLRTSEDRGLMPPPDTVHTAMAPTATPAIPEETPTLVAEAAPPAEERISQPLSPDITEEISPEKSAPSPPHTTSSEPSRIDKSHKGTLEAALKEAEEAPKEAATSVAMLPSPFDFMEKQPQFTVQPAPSIAKSENPLLHVATRKRQSEVIESIQQHKMNLYLAGQSRLIPEIHKIERFIADIASATERTDNVYLNNLKIFQEAEQCLLDREYLCAIQNYNTVAEHAPGSLMAFLSQFQAANVSYEQIEDYKASLTNYQKCLENYPSHYISEEKRGIILDRIDTLTKNSMENWKPLRLYRDAQAAPLPEAISLLKQLITQYPGCSLVMDAIEMLASRVITEEDLDQSITESVIAFFHQYGEQSEAVDIRQLVQYKTAELFQFRLRNLPQALLEYTRAVEIDPGSQLAQKAKSRIQTLYRRRVNFR